MVAESQREVNRLRTARDSEVVGQQNELERVDQQIRAVIEAIEDGLRTPSMKEELFALEARKRELAAQVARAPAPPPRLHPKLAERYRQRIDRLHEELNRPELRTEAAEALRGLINEVRLIPETGDWRSSCTAIWRASWRSAPTAKSPSRRAATGCK